MHLVDVLSRLAHTAIVVEFSQVSFAEETADRADVDGVVIRDIKQSLFQEASTSVRDHAITFHFSETKSTIARSTFSRLSGQDLSWSSATSVDLISDHMLQSLVIGGTKEDLHFKSLSSEATVHRLVTVALVSKVV